MATDNQPTIVVLGFSTKYEMHPVRGQDPLNDNVDAKGFLVDEKGKRVMERRAEDYVTFAPAHSPQNTKNTERVRMMIPDAERVGEDPDGVKLAFMNARWAQIEPAYDAWKKGQELPISGTPLTVWPGINEGQVEVFRQFGIRTVEGVRDLSEVAVERVKLPNMRDLRNQARLFLENMAGAEAAAREDARDLEIASLREQLDALREAQANQASAPTGQDADDVATLRMQLTAKGIDFNKNWAAPKLRSLLAEAA